MEHDTTVSGAGFLIRPVAAADNAVLAGLLRDVMEEFGATGAGTSLHDPEMLDMASAYGSHGSAYFVIESAAGLVGGYRRLYLETRQTMRQARRLYERNGFTPVGKPIGHTGHFGCDAWYVRDL